MPSLPDIPGKDLVTGTGRRAGRVAVASGLAVIAIGGYVVRRVLHRGGGEEAAGPDPIAETPTAPPGAAKAPKAKKAAKAKKPPEAKAEKPPAPPKPPVPPKPPKPPAAAEEPPITTGTDAPPKPEAEPGNHSKDQDPHHALNNPVGDPDPTEWPDPYEKREDPRDPADPDAQPFGEEPHPATNAESTSEPHPREDPEAGDRAEPPRRENLDD